jgi:hypothetical protein
VHPGIEGSLNLAIREATDGLVQSTGSRPKVEEYSMTLRARNWVTADPTYIFGQISPELNGTRQLLGVL